MPQLLGRGGEGGDLAQELGRSLRCRRRCTVNVWEMRVVGMEKEREGKEEGGGGLRTLQTESFHPLLCRRIA